MQLDYPKYEVVLVDNASSDASLEYVAEHFPQVHVVKSTRNLGFAGGNNLGIQSAKGDLIGLVNNDTEVEPGWLRELVSALMQNRNTWAVGSKIVFFRKYVELHLDCATFRPSDTGLSDDKRELGMLLDESSAFVDCDYRKSIFVDGFWDAEQIHDRKARWTSGRARLMLPIMPVGEVGEYRLLLSLSGTSSGVGKCFVVTLAGKEIGRGVLEEGFQEYIFIIPGADVNCASFDLINNAGTYLDSNGEAGDRGIYEPDRGQYDQEENVEALCGAAMLIRRSVLESIGLFDSRFFMYYEDTDLCWRIRRAGGELRYVPSSVVRHIHTGSSVEWSPMFVYYVSRNHVLIRFKHAPLYIAIKGYLVEIARLVAAVRAWGRLALHKKAEMQTREWDEFRLRLRVQADLIRKIPGSLARRWGYKGTAKDRLGA